MDDQSLIVAIIGCLVGAVVTISVRRVLGIFEKTDSIAVLSSELKGLSAQITRVEAVLIEVKDLAKDVAVMKRDQQTMWHRVDELRRHHYDLQRQILKGGDQ